MAVSQQLWKASLFSDTRPPTGGSITRGWRMGEEVRKVDEEVRQK